MPVVCFDGIFLFAKHLLQLYHSQGYNNPWMIIKDAVQSVYNFWTANPDHGPVCSSQ